MKYIQDRRKCDAIFIEWQRILTAKLNLWYTNEPRDIHR